MLPPGADLRIGELAAEPRDRTWSAGMEERLISQIARWDVTLADWYTECRTSRCIVALLYPASSESPVLEAPARPTLPKAHTELMHATNLIGNAIWRVPAADGTIVYLHHFHRRCGPDWKCLE